MKIVIAIALLLIGCALHPTESSTEQATLAETQARIAATNAVIAFENRSCTEDNVCAPTGLDGDSEDFGFVDCAGSQSGVMCCIWLFCCSYYYSGDLNCGYYGN